MSRRDCFCNIASGYVCSECKSGMNERMTFAERMEAAKGRIGYWIELADCLGRSNADLTRQLEERNLDKSWVDDFDACDSCVRDRYADMPPIRKILWKMGFFK